MKENRIADMTSGKRVVEKKYNIIMNRLLDMITDGTYPPGSSLPSEKELMDMFGASRITVRRAVDELVLAGYIEKHQGKNSCVKKQAETQELNTISSYTEEITGKGMTPSRKVITKELRLCTEKEQKRLCLEKATPVFSMERIIYADGFPFCFTRTVLPYDIYRDIELHDFENESLYDIMEKDYGTELLSSKLKLKAVTAGERLAGYLMAGKDTPLLRTAAVTSGIPAGETEARPVEYFMSYYVTDFFEYTLTQTRKKG